MAVVNETGFSGPFYANGVTTVFPFDFTVASADEILVTVDDIALDPEDYVVTLAGDFTGSVTISPALASGTIYTQSVPNFKQEAVFQRFGPFYPDLVNPPLDRAAIRDIWLKGEVERAPRVPIGGGLPGQFPVVGEDGGWDFSPVAAGGFYGPAAYEFLATEGQTVFAVPVNLVVAPVVYANGGRLAAADFTYAASTVTLSGARAADDIVTIIASEDALLPRTTIDRVAGLQAALDSKATPAYITGVLGSRRANVLDIAGWDPTGANDMASGYQTLVNQAATAGVPLDGIAGKALLGSTITLPGGHVFEGVNGGAVFIDPTKASSFLIAHTGKGFIRNGGSNAPVSITNQVTVRNQPAPSGPTYTPTDHDFDYYFADISDLKMSRILTLNATRGIYFNGGRNNIKEWGGQCFKIGLQIDWSYDTCDFESIHLWPYWNQVQAVREYMQNNLTSFALKRVDNSFFNKIFSIWHKYGFYIDWFAGDGPNKPAGTAYKLKLTQADLDIGDYAYWVAAAANGHTAKFSQVTAQARDEIIASSLLTVNGPNCRITGEFNGTDSGGNVILCASSSAGGFLDLVGTGNNWNRTATGFPAVEVQAGGAHVDLLPGSRFTNGNGGAVSSGDVTVWTP